MITLTKELLKKIFPKMSVEQADVFVNRQAAMRDILASPQALALCFANVQAETRGFELHGLIENIRYSAEGMADTWPNRFHKNADLVRLKYGTTSGWQNKAFDDIYGNRMGNRPGTSDGSTYIGRGGPQVTGRDGYEAIGSLIRIDLVNHPELCARPEYQCDIVAAFWHWKNLSRFVSVDHVDIVAARHAWNGGTNGLAVVEKSYPKFLKIISGYQAPESAAVVIKSPSKGPADEALRTLQADLDSMGYHSVGDPDGRWGGQTAGAIAGFLTDRGKPTIGIAWPSADVQAELEAALGEGFHKPVKPGRALATAADLRDKLPALKHLDVAAGRQKVIAWGSTIGGTLTGAIQVIPDAQAKAQPIIDVVKGYINDVPSWFWFVAIAAVAVYMVRSTSAAKSAVVADYQTGKTN